MKNKLQLAFFGLLAAIASLFAIEMVHILFDVLSEKPLATDILDHKILIWLISLSVFIEESFKYIAVRKAVSERKVFTNPIFSGIIIGSGFAVTEILLLFAKNMQTEKIGILNLAAITIIHISTASFMSYFSPKSNGRTTKNIAIAFSLPFFLHLAYNISQANEIFWLSNSSLVVLLFLLMIALSDTKKWRGSFA